VTVTPRVDSRCHVPPSNRSDDYHAAHQLPVHRTTCSFLQAAYDRATDMPRTTTIGVRPSDSERPTTRVERFPHKRHRRHIRSGIQSMSRQSGRPKHSVTCLPRVAVLRGSRSPHVGRNRQTSCMYGSAVALECTSVRPEAWLFSWTRSRGGCIRHHLAFSLKKCGPTHMSIT
jgi:hypothetical protein